MIFDKPKLYEIGEKYHAEAKAYLVAHNQEKADDSAREYRYKFPAYVNGETQAPPPAKRAARMPQPLHRSRNPRRRPRRTIENRFNVP